eukprot:NODE_1935_length_2333_cov_4.926111.p1 GENE.NODE_1935_length_2333_cov_4.926111~~NODE_1935_length_2333_cov_4.926111.p1  ORF type:complete len:680 (-),score=249.00 NODE_1935_length_2333_cov_4.926111:208-2247(-)
MGVNMLFIFALATAGLVPVAGTATESFTSANPIRRVVKMLEALKVKVAAEGEEEKKVFDAFICNCKSEKAALSESIAAAMAKIEELQSSIKTAASQKERFVADLAQHSADRDAARKTMAEASNVRAKESAQFATNEQDLKTNIAATAKAIAALAAGTGGSFLQSDSVKVVRSVVAADRNMIEATRKEVMAFLSGSYTPQSGEISGILKQLQDDMEKNLGEVQAAEAAALKEHAELTAAKQKEEYALTDIIEKQTEQKGELAVHIVQMKGDLEDTTESLAENRKFLTDLTKDCAFKAEQYELRVKTRAEELVALTETLEILSGDDALDLFKKTLATPVESFLQLGGASSKTLRAHALNVVRQAQHGRHAAVGLDFLALALQGKQKGFNEVLAMVDEMVVLLASDQTTDDKKKEQCDKNLADAADEMKGLGRSKFDLQAIIERAEYSRDSTIANIKALQKGIQELDASVAEASAIRKEEHAEYIDLMASNTAAKELIRAAKNRMNKFYSSRLHIEAKKVERTSQQRISESSLAFMQIEREEQPANGGYQKQHEGSNGVIAMMDLLIADLDKEMTEAKADEESAQQLYEKLLKDAQEKRARDLASIANLQSTNAALEGELHNHGEALRALNTNIAAAAEHTGALHSECDWLVQHYVERKEARGTESDALSRAKAVLSGADYA